MPEDETPTGGVDQTETSAASDDGMKPEDVKKIATQNYQRGQRKGAQQGREEALSELFEKLGIADASELDELIKVRDERVPAAQREVTTLKGQLTKTAKQLEEEAARRRRLEEHAVSHEILSAIGNRARDPKYVEYLVRQQSPRYDHESGRVVFFDSDGNPTETTTQQIVDGLLQDNNDRAAPTSPVGGAGSRVAQPGGGASDNALPQSWEELEALVNRSE